MCVYTVYCISGDVCLILQPAFTTVRFSVNFQFCPLRVPGNQLIIAFFHAFERSDPRYLVKANTFIIRMSMCFYFYLDVEKRNREDEMIVYLMKLPQFLKINSENLDTKF